LPPSERKETCEKRITRYRNLKSLRRDEPTNHLDLKTKDIFQNALLSYTGTVVIVSHNRFFLDHLVHRVIEIRDCRRWRTVLPAWS